MPGDIETLQVGMRQAIVPSRFLQLCTCSFRIKIRGFHHTCSAIITNFVKQTAMQEGTLKQGQAKAQPFTSAVVIANPTSGSYFHNAHQIEETILYLRQQGWQVTLKQTRREGDARKFAREAVEQHVGIVVVIGGDGTINEAIQELAGSETALGILPSGTVNVWAREVGIPLDNVGARSALLNGQIRRVDLGHINDRYFLLMAGIGIDGEITHAVERRPAKRLGILGYLLIGAWLGLGYPAFRVTLDIDDYIVKATALQVIFGNTQLYGGAIKYTWKAKCDDGLLDICIIRKQSLLGRVMVAIDFLLRRQQRHRRIRYETGKTIKVYTRKPVAIQVDGEPLYYTTTETTPTLITIKSGALKVIVPQQVPEDLFSQ